MPLGEAKRAPGKAGSHPAAGMSQVGTLAMCTVLGVETSSLQQDLISQTPPVPAPGPERGREAATGSRKMHILSFPPKGASPWCCQGKRWKGDGLPTLGISLGSYLCEAKDFLSKQATV